MEVHGPPEPGWWLRTIHATIDERVHVRLSFDYDAGFPAEVFVPAMGWGFESADLLGITEGLGATLSSHQQWWQDHLDVEGVHVEGSAAEWRRWRRDLTTLADRLQGELESACDLDRS